MAAGNDELINSIIADNAYTDVEKFTKVLEQLELQTVENIKQAIALKKVIGDSISNSQLDKAATQAALNYEKIQQAQNKTAQTTLKLSEVQAQAAVKQQERDLKVAQAIVQREAKQASANAKEIAQAEAQAAKLQAIQDAANRKANVKFPTGSGQPFNPVTTDDGQTVSATEANKAFAASQTGMNIPIAQSTEAIAAENAALLEQQEVLGSLTVAQRANIEQLLALQVERSANTAELKALNVEDAISGERAVFLTAEQVRLKIAISEVTVALNRQTKEALAADGAMTKLDQTVLLLRTEYEQLSVAERESEQGLAMKAELEAVTVQNRELSLATGNTTKNIGNYTKATDIAEKISAKMGTQLIRLAAQFLIVTVAFGAITWLYDYIKALDMFNPIADAATRRQNALIEALSGSEFAKGIENTEKLGANLDLASKGFQDSDKAINEYNETIGKTFGYVNNLNDAQQGFIDHKEAYIQAILQEAEVQAIANDAAKEFAELAEKNAKLRDQQQKNAELERTHPLFNNRSSANVNQGINESIASNEARMKSVIDQATKAIEGVQGNKIQGVSDTTGTDAAAALRIKIANDELEQQKIIAQNQLNNQQLSYATRLQAARDFYNASTQIEKNNEALALKELPAKDARREEAEKASNNKLLQLTLDYQKQRQAILKESADDSIKITEQQLEAQKDGAKSIIDSESSTLDQRLKAIEIYYDASGKLITVKQKEQVDLAGANGKKQQIAMNEANNAILALTNENEQQINDAYKKTYDQQEAGAKEHDKNLLGILSQGNADQQAANDLYFSKQQSALLERFKKGEIGEQEYQESVKAITNVNRIANLQAEINYQQELIDIKKKANPDANVSGEQTTINKSQYDEFKIVQDLQTEYAQKAADARSQIREQEFALASQLITSLQTVVDASYQAQIDNIEAQQTALQTNSDAQKTLIDGSIASSKTKAEQDKVLDAETANSKEQLAQKQKKIQADEATFNKEISAVNIAINTAESVAKIEAAIAVAEAEALIYLANPVTAALYPGIAALIEAQQIQVGLTIALGAAQEAAIIGAKTPAYWKGTPHAKGGPAIVGELGHELIETPAGNTFLSPATATLMNIPRGSKIKPNDETIRMLARPERLNYAGGEQIDLKTLEKLMQENIKVTKANKPIAKRVPLPGSARQAAYERSMRR